MNPFFPRLNWAQTWQLLKLAGIGALVSASYGVIHDQLTFSISREYFSQFKFVQFAWADPRPALGERGFVAVIGILASWWVGAFAGWFLGRIAIWRTGEPLPISQGLQAFARIFVWAVSLGFLAGILAPSSGTPEIAIAFNRVGQIHNFGYLGAAIGLIHAIVRVWNLKPKSVQ